jgi:hypothetical protein
VSLSLTDFSSFVLLRASQAGRSASQYPSSTPALSDLRRTPPALAYLIAGLLTGARHTRASTPKKPLSGRVGKHQSSLAGMTSIRTPDHLEDSCCEVKVEARVHIL